MLNQSMRVRSYYSAERRQHGTDERSVLYSMEMSNNGKVLDKYIYISAILKLHCPPELVAPFTKFSCLANRLFLLLFFAKDEGSNMSLTESLTNLSTIYTT